MSQRKDSRMSRFITQVAKRLGSAFWEDLRRVANTVMAVGLYGPVVYPHIWHIMILMPFWGLFLWTIAYRMEGRSKEDVDSSTR
jgi:hypothetical protein